MRFLLPILLLLQPCLVFCQPIVPGRNIAVLFAVQNYQNNTSWTPLVNPINECRTLKEILEKNYVFHTVLLVENPTKAVFLKTLQDLKLQPKDNLFVYFSGHGQEIKVKNEENQEIKEFYFPLIDSKKGDKPSSVAADELKEMVRKMQGDKNKDLRHFLLVVDACYSGSVTKGDMEYHEEQMMTPSSRYISSTTDRLVPDGNSFARAMIKVLRENTEPFLSEFMLFKKIEEMVRNDPNRGSVNPQQGDFTTDKLGGMFYFVRNWQRLNDFVEQRQSGEGLFRARRNGKYGFYNANGEVVISCIYDDVGFFEEGLCAVQKDGKWGFVDKTGKWLIAAQYDADALTPVPFFRDGIAKVFLNSNALYIDKNGNPATAATSNTTSSITTPPGSSIEMVWVEGGTFTMGCTVEQGDECYEYEKPAHRVTVSSFYIGKYEVTQKQWRDIMGSNPSNHAGCDNCPVEMVSWDDVQTFIEKLNSKTGKTYRLPTEAEWEFAARGGNKSKGYKYAGSNSIGDVAEYEGNNNKSTKPVGGKSPNELGIYDMSGNVWEWCSDWHGAYSSYSQTNPKGASSGTYRVLRGGSWSYIARGCRVSYRDNGTPAFRYSPVGFRLVLVP